MPVHSSVILPEVNTTLPLGLSDPALASLVPAQPTWVRL